jgi:hypothetical protein
VGEIMIWDVSFGLNKVRQSTDFEILKSPVLKVRFLKERGPPPPMIDSVLPTQLDLISLSTAECHPLVVR